MGWEAEQGWDSFFSTLLKGQADTCAGRNFLIATTGIISGSSIIEGIAGTGGKPTTAATV